MRPLDQPILAMSPDMNIQSRERDFARAMPQLQRLASRLLPSALDVESVISEVRDVWSRTEGSFDAPTRHFLRLIAQACIERQRAITRSAPDPTEEERAVIAIADVAEVSLLIAVNRLPRRAREAFVASVLGRTVHSNSEEAAVLKCAKEIRADRPHVETLRMTSNLPTTQQSKYPDLATNRTN